MSKSLWGTKELHVFGHVIKAGQGCTANPAKVEYLLDMKAPGTILLPKSFLELQVIYLNANLTMLS